MRLRRPAVIVLAAVATASVTIAGPVPALARSVEVAARPAAVPLLPLGPAGTAQTTTEQALAAGVRLTTVTVGTARAADSWVLRALTPTEAAALDLAARIRAAGRPASIERVDDRAVDDPDQGPLGWLVVSSGYPDETAAKTAQTELAQRGVSGLGVSSTALYERGATGPWVVRVLRVDRNHLRQVHAALATDVVPGRETTSSVATRRSALAAVNGGYFVVGEADGVPGDLAGVAVQDGVYDSEAVADRAALVVDGPRSQVASITTGATLRAQDGARVRLNGVDRAVGRIRDCGEPGDRPTEMAQQDIACTNPDEIVVFDGAHGASAEVGAGVAVTLDRRDRVVGVSDSRGGAIPTGGSILEGIGAGATWLRSHVVLGTVVRTATDLRADDRVLGLHRGTSVVNGGPFLVRDGATFVDAYREGFVHPGDPGFYFAFAVSRNPRTMAGLTGDGDLLLVTVDGRAPGYSIGMSFAEQARVMRALGAQDAVNLDGGGSTTMVTAGRLLGRPSDATGERPVGDVLVVEPQRRDRLG